MKRTERHHLKENAISVLARQARDLVDTRKQGMTMAVGAIVIVGAGILGWMAWRDHTQSLAHTMLAEAEAGAETRGGARVAPGAAVVQPRGPPLTRVGRSGVWVG